jgi:multidrug efflux pump subunit AcrA (membrane-fusion protein)
MLKKKGFWIILAAVILVGAGAYAFMNKNNSTQAESTETTVQTATAFIGTLTISASGTGTVIAAEEASVGFYKAGTVGEILVSVGTEVTTRRKCATRCV